jgi:hypothetical protein
MFNNCKINNFYSIPKLISIRDGISLDAIRSKKSQKSQDSDFIVSSGNDSTLNTK